MCKFGFLSVSALLLLAGCGSGEKTSTQGNPAEIDFAQREDLPEVSGGLVLAVGGETITSDEVILPLIEDFRPFAQASDFEQFKKQVRGELEKVIVGKISNILLYNEAKKDAGEQIEEALEKAAEAEVRKLIVDSGGDYAKAEKALKQNGLDWTSFREYQKKMILSQSYIASQLPGNKPITYSELVDCYNEMKEEFFATPAMLKFRLIDIEAAKLEAADPNRSQLEQARDFANELMGRLRTGEDFGELALRYSHGHRASFGGLWKPVQPDSLAEPYNILAVEAEKLEAGELTGPIEAGEHIFIMKLEEKQAGSVEPFEKVQHRVEEKIIFDRRRKAADEFSAKLVQQAALGNKDEFVDFCLAEIYWMCNQ